MGKNNKKKDQKDIKDPVKLKVSFRISEQTLIGTWKQGFPEQELRGGPRMLLQSHRAGPQGAHILH